MTKYELGIRSAWVAGLVAMAAVLNGILQPVVVTLAAG